MFTFTRQHKEEGLTGHTRGQTTIWLRRLGPLLAVLALSACATPSQRAVSPATAPAAPQDEARRFLDTGTERFSKDDADGAIAAFTMAIELDPQLSLAYYSRAKARTRQGDLAGAIADFTKAIEVEPKLVNSYYLRGLLRAKTGDGAGAIADFTTVIERDPEEPIAFFQRGLLRARQGDEAGAIADFTAVIDIDPTEAIAFLQRGLLRAKTGDRSGATQDLRQALASGIPSQEDQTVARNTLQELER